MTPAVIAPDPLRVVQSQIAAAATHLATCQPTDIDWPARAAATAAAVVPWLCAIGPDVCGFCEEVYNAPDRLRAAWAELRAAHPALGPLGDRVDFHLAREQVLIDEIAGDVVSRVLADYLLADGTGRRLRANGHSDYPDLFFADRDYTGLPRHARRRGRRGHDEGRWAALKGAPPRPVRVPDGVEIKTCRNTFRVDCHHNHMGLHVALFYVQRGTAARMVDLLAAFLTPDDYRASRINTGATTTKQSFGPHRFVSLLPDPPPVGSLRRS